MLNKKKQQVTEDARRVAIEEARLRVEIARAKFGGDETKAQVLSGAEKSEEAGSIRQRSL